MYIIWTALVGPIIVLEMPYGPLLTGRNVTQRQAARDVAARVITELADNSELDKK